jgi:hypothetical protein
VYTHYLDCTIRHQGRLISKSDRGPFRRGGLTRGGESPSPRPTSDGDGPSSVATTPCISPLEHYHPLPSMDNFRQAPRPDQSTSEAESSRRETFAGASSASPPAPKPKLPACDRCKQRKIKVSTQRRGSRTPAAPTQGLPAARRAARQAADHASPCDLISVMLDFLTVARVAKQGRNA